MSAPEGYVPAFGVPYANSVIVGRMEAKECPFCGRIIESKIRKDFESFSGEEYAKHYEAQHAIGDGRILVDGEWYMKDEWGISG